MGGLRPTELCILAGRPGSGKTTLAISILANLAFNNVPTVFITYEMPIEELTTKVVSNRAEIDGNTLS
jgi:replicative DNA helicase